MAEAYGERQWCSPFDAYSGSHSGRQRKLSDGHTAGGTRQDTERCCAGNPKISGRDISVLEGTVLDILRPDLLTHFWWTLFCKKPNFHFNAALQSSSRISIPKFFSAATPMLDAKIVVYQT